MNSWYVYILKCNDDTLYTGITNNLSKRLNTHNIGKGAKYTRCRLPVKMIYFQRYKNRSIASKEEYRIKNLTRKEKFLLINL